MSKSEQKAREWWIVEGVGVRPLYDNEDEAIRAAGYSAEQEPTFTYHVIEFSAFAAQAKEIAVLKADLQAAKLQNQVTNSNWPYEKKLHEKVERLREALNVIEKKEGYCIFGTPDLADTPDQAFRQGSAFTYAEVAAIAREALNKERK